jgi:hypothetical protein
MLASREEVRTRSVVPPLSFAVAVVPALGAHAESGVGGMEAARRDNGMGRHRAVPRCTRA